MPSGAADGFEQKLHFGAFRKVERFERTQRAVGVTRAEFSRYRRRRRFRFRWRRRSRSRGFVECFVGQRVGFGIFFTVYVLDAERLKTLGHSAGALEQGTQLRALHFVLTTHLAYQ